MSASITLTLPYPPSANRVWRTYMPRGFKAPVTVVSKEGKDYKAVVAKIARAFGCKSPMVGRVAVAYRLYPSRPLDFAKRMRADPLTWDDTVQCIDLDNAQKVLFDSLKGVVFVDDKWVRQIHAERMEPDGEARVVVTITPIVMARPQQALFEGEAA